MPLFDYVCKRCAKQFEDFVLKDSATPACPTCAQPDEVSKVPFGPVTVGTAGKDVFRPPNIKAAFAPVSRRRRGHGR
jgi:putative FmdB family regulatory protein